MSLEIDKPLVSVDWLFVNLENENLIILDATLPKVTENKDEQKEVQKKQIKGARFFDIKNTFSDINAPFPNTILSPKEFERKTQIIGINDNSCIVVYDDLGIYSSPRVWWMFQLMGFQNIAVLNGGFPEWISKKYPIEKPVKHQYHQGNFKVNFKTEKIKFTNDVLTSINNDDNIVVDARSNGRFFGTAPEPRKNVKSGHIPNSISLPYSEITEEGRLISEEKLKTIFKRLNITDKEMIFSCGTGITASVLALGATISGYQNHAVYDGSWTEWVSTTNLPIEI